MLMQSASHYGGLEATPLARPGYYNEFINRVQERDFLPEITNTEIDARIVQCNQQVQIMMAPYTGEWKPYSKNAEMVPDQVTGDAKCLWICNAAYNDIKIDEMDIHFACERWAPWEEKIQQSVYESWVSYQRKWVFGRMIAEASEQTKGNNAGYFGNVKLGAPSAPVVVNKDNIVFVLAQLQQVLAETLRWVDREMFIVLPVQFRTILAMSRYADAAYVGGCLACSPIIDGLWEQQLFGFNVIETVHSPAVIEDNNTICFYVIAGHRQAFAYAADIIQGRIIHSTRTFGVEYQMLGVWGGVMLYEDAVAIGYWSFEY